MSIRRCMIRFTIVNRTMVTIDENALAYAATGLGYSMMHSIFTFYYVKLFLDTYKISQEWFNITQSIYLVWNAINDPLFAYFQDNSKWKIFQRRRYSILYGAPLFAFSFLLPWFPWRDYEPNDWLTGVHLLVSLCFYDTLFTFVLLAYSSLYTEISSLHDNRLRLTQYNVIGTLIGSSSVFWCELFSDSLNNFRNFQIFCVCVAFLSWLAMHYTGLNAKSEYDLEHGSTLKATQCSDSNNTQTSIFIGYWQIICQKHVFLLVTVNFCTVFHVASVRSFLKIFADNLLPSDNFPDLSRKLLYGSVFVVPQVCVLLMSQVVKQLGAFRMYQITFYIKIVSSATMYVIGPYHTWILACFIVTDSCITMVNGQYFNLLMSDCIEEDMKIYRKSSPRSSMFYGMNALIVKPAQSLAPMLVLAVLSRNGYESANEEMASDPDVLFHLHGIMFQIVCFMPLILGLIQTLIWSKYTLRDSHRGKDRVNLSDI